MDALSQPTTEPDDGRQQALVEEFIAIHNLDNSAATRLRDQTADMQNEVMVDIKNN